MTEVLALIDSFLDDIRHQSIVGVDTVTDRLLDIRLTLTTAKDEVADFYDTADDFWKIVGDQT